MAGQGAQGRKLRGDLRREVLNLLEKAPKGINQSLILKQLGEQSSLPVDITEFKAVLSALESEQAIGLSKGQDRRITLKAGGGMII